MEAVTALTRPRIVPITIKLRPSEALELWLEGVRDPLCGLKKPGRRLFDRILLMAGSKSDYLEPNILNWLLGQVAFTQPSPVHFGLWGAAGSLVDASTGSTAGELSGGAYARVALTNNTTNFPTVGANTSKKNGVDIVFPTASANWNSGNPINQGMVADAATLGNSLLWGDITVPKAILNGDTGKILTNDFIWSED